MKMVLEQASLPQSPSQFMLSYCPLLTPFTPPRSLFLLTGVMKMVLEQVGKVLANDPTGRAQFVHSGGLATVQQMAEAPGSKLKEAVEIINSVYPEEIVKYYSPSYSQHLMEKLESMATSQAAY